MPYNPPYKITPKILSLVDSISKTIGRGMTDSYGINSQLAVEDGNIY